MNQCVFVSLEQGLYIYSGGGATSTVPPYCVATVAQDRQTTRKWQREERETRAKYK